MDEKLHESCLICDKHKGIAHRPPGGYVYRGKYFSICHAPLNSGPLGTIFIESNRHILDFADMTAEELTAYSRLLKLIYTDIKRITGAERIYQVTMIDGVPHFHSWFIPRRRSDQDKGLKFLSRDFECELDDVEKFIDEIRMIF